MKKHVSEIMLNREDFTVIEKYLTGECGLDSLDIAELLIMLEKRKNVYLVW